MPTIAAYETIKGFSVFDECADDSWADTESYYGKVAESRRAYHRLPDVVRVSSKDMSGIVLFPPKQSARYSLEQEFKELAEKWRMEIEVLSSTSEIVSNFNYYRIIALGKDIVPLILQELQENGGQWYLALRVLTNQNPVNPEDVGNIKKMKMAWLNWGREHRLI
jgi:hypothetical protein